MSLLEHLGMYEDIIVDICTVLKFLHVVVVEWSVETSFNNFRTRQAHSVFHRDS
jgi:hypothetical protein